MKKIIIVLAGIFFAFAVNAQDTKTEAKPETAPAAVKQQPKTHDYVTMKDGKMMVMNAETMMPMEKDMEMTNGIKVMTDGSVMKKDGSKIMMKEGDKVYMNGAVRSVGERKSTEKKAEGQEQK